MKHYCLLNFINEEVLEEYQRLHMEADKDLLMTLKECGTQEECIFMHGNIAIIYIKCDDINDCIHRFYETEVGIEWGKKMQPFLMDSQAMNDDGTSRDEIICLKKVFDINEQLESIQ